MEEWCCIFGCVVGFGAVAEESTRPGLCRVCKLVHVGRGQGRSVQNGSASRESAPWVGSFRLCMGRCLLRGTYTKASSGWGTQCDPSDVRVSAPNSFWRILVRRVGHTLGLTSTDTPGEVTMYGESVGAEVWREGVVCHAALMVLEVRLTHHLVGSTSDVVVATGLAYI
ncbi:hypothetical protein BHM03_00007042 [Ensete ventricosum]|nr:hypothetical protein BHM03_00007042 [Ensete ventricosum]